MYVYTYMHIFKETYKKKKWFQVWKNEIKQSILASLARNILYLSVSYNPMVSKSISKTHASSLTDKKKIV